MSEINPDVPAASRVVGRRAKLSPLKVMPGEIEHAREWHHTFCAEGALSIQNP